MLPPRQHNVKIPPVPPRKQHINSIQQVAVLEVHDLENKSKIANVVDLKPKKDTPSNSPLLLPSKSHQQQAVEPELQIKKSPVEISELVTSSKVKTLTNKKKNSLIAKRRRVTLKSLGTSATIQGHLYRRAKDKSEVAYWAKLYFVLMDTALYGFKSKDAQKADCVVFLVGFTVGVANEVHSKEFAFKVYHPKKTLYLAAETSEAMTQWIDYIRQATLKGTTNLDCDSKELYSETECSDDEFEASMSKHQTSISSTTSPSQSNHDKSISSDQTPPSSKYHYHLNFGSLKKTFGRSSANDGSPQDNKFLGFFSSSKNEKKSTDIVPTAQFKTYKKVKENNGGLQLGATSMINSNVSDMYLSSGGNDNSSIFTGLSTDVKFHEEIVPIIERESFRQTPNNIIYNINNNNISISSSSSSSNDNTYESQQKQKASLRKTHNFLHASNPNLLDFNFHQAALDFPAPNISNCATWDHHSGMTLLDFMLQQRVEEMKDMYNKRVDQGFERLEEKNIVKNVVEKPVIPSKPDTHIDKIQRRLLPAPPDYAQSFKPSDVAILYTRSKEGQKLRDFGYELISNDDDKNKEQQQQQQMLLQDKNNDIKLWSSKSKRKISPLTGSVKKKSGFNWIISHDKEECHTVNLGNSGSFRKLMKSSGDQSSASSKSVENTDFLDNKGWLQNAKLKKSNTDCQTQASTSKIVRKNSVPNNSSSSLLNKLTFSSNTKEKKLLGSPKLHRAIFGRNSNTSNSSSTGHNLTPKVPNNSADHEIFTSITFPKVS